MKPQRVLFLCIGNSCRSQMAEGFARTYGKDVMEAHSAGFFPANIVSPLTIKSMAEKNIGMGHSFPKPIESVFASAAPFDAIVNMSGERLPAGVTAAKVEEWTVRDPIGENEEVFRSVANQIEQLVMRLILQMRAAAAEPKFDTPRPRPRQ
jgi:arsenate reductase